jgi:two-component system chemotaxis sensor kinase CheA
MVVTLLERRVGADMDLDKYRELYLTEAHRQLDTMEEGVSALGDAFQDSESLVGISRAAHTLKGMSATMGYEELAQLAGEVERLLESGRFQASAGTSELSDLLRDCVHALGVLLQNVVDGSSRDVGMAVLLQRMEPLI